MQVLKFTLAVVAVVATFMYPKPLHALGGSSEERIEVPIQKVMIPRNGFDDNDHVQAVISGELPHACITLGETRIERVEAKKIALRQYGWIRTTGACAEGDVSDLPLPYTAEVSLGRLPAGGYELLYRNGDAEIRPFSVREATTLDIDDTEYAAVTGALTPALVFDDEKVTINVNGVIDTSCQRLSNRLGIERQGDVIVVLPILMKSERPCTGTFRPFRRVFSLEPLDPGQYLVHIRSRSGKAINRTFSVARLRR